MAPTRQGHRLHRRRPGTGVRARGRGLDVAATSLAPLRVEPAGALLLHDRAKRRQSLVQGVEPRLEELEQQAGALRQKLEMAGAPRLIHTVRGVGYMLKAE